MNPCVRLALASALAFACTAAWSSEPIPADFASIHRDSSLAGKRIRIDACIGLPMSANPHEPDDIVLLYPCGAAKDESLVEVAILGRLLSREVAQPLVDADVSFLGDVRARLAGTLTREGGDAPADDGQAYYLLTIDRITEPSQFAPPPGAD